MKKGNWIMTTYERAAIYLVRDELYIKQTREIEYLVVAFIKASNM